MIFSCVSLQFSISWYVTGYVYIVCMRGGSHPLHTIRTRTTAMGRVFFVVHSHGKKMVDEKKLVVDDWWVRGVNCG